MIVEDYLRPAAVRAKAIEVRDGSTCDRTGNEITRVEFHSFRHSLASFVMANGENPKVVQTILRHSKMDMTLYYTHSQKHKMITAARLRSAAHAPSTGAGTGAIKKMPETDKFATSFTPGG